MGIAIVDIKTTGKNPVLDRICHIGIAVYDSKFNLKKEFSTWINPDVKLSKAACKFLGISNDELATFPDFDEFASTIHGLLSGNKLAGFRDKVSILDFIKEELSLSGYKISHENKNFIEINRVEELINPRDIPSLMYKYTGERIEPNINHSKDLGMILKNQLDFIGTSLTNFKYREAINNTFGVMLDRYFKRIGEDIYLNFGKYRGELIQEVDTEYLEWILEGDFPVEFKEVIKEFLDGEE